MNLLAIDPGNVTGWAMFSDEDLILAGTMKKVEILRGGVVLKPDLALIEMPRWYPHDHKDVNDLLDLSVFVGELKHFYEAQGCTVELVWPRTWKGNVPKGITNRRTVEVLSPEEVALIPVRPAKTHDHNTLDAIGLGLWKLGRLR